MTRSLDLPALDRIDTLAQELAMLQDRSKRRIAILGSRHVPVVSIHLVELVARSLAQEGHSLITTGDLIRLGRTSSSGISNRVNLGDRSP